MSSFLVVACKSLIAYRAYSSCIGELIRFLIGMEKSLLGSVFGGEEGLSFSLVIEILNDSSILCSTSSASDEDSLIELLLRLYWWVGGGCVLAPEI